MNSRRGLGRGLGALIPTGPPSAESPAGAQDNVPFPWGAAADPDPSGAGGAKLGAFFAELPVTAIRANTRQPRQVFDEDALAELVASITEVGLLQPVVVRPIADESAAYELVMGERRWRAAQQAGLTAVPAIVRETTDDAMLRDALLENLHRAQLNPLEEGAAYQQLLEDFGCTHEELAARLGRSRPQVTNTLRLLRLGPAVQRRVAAGVLSAGHARALVSVADPVRQDQLAHRAVAEQMSVRALEEAAAVDDREAAGADGSPARKRPGTRPVAPGLEDLAGRLSELFDTRVRVDLGKRKGRISIEFATLDDLSRIMSLMESTTELPAGHSGRSDLVGE